MKTVCIMQARMGSSRLPGKVLKKICGKTIIEHDIDRLKLVNSIDEIIIATTTNKEDDEIVKLAENIGVKVFRGSETNVLSRYYFAAKESNADIIVRVTSDCPLLDYNICDKIINKFKSSNNIDYVSNTINRTYPRGYDVEVFSMYALEKAYKEADKEYEKEHVTPYIWENTDIFKIKQVCNDKDYSNLRVTLDTEEDFVLIKNIYEKLYKTEPVFGFESIINLYTNDSKIFEINKDIFQKNIKE